MRGSSSLRGGVVIDDELLQEFLSKASACYNNGEYKGAIQAWKDALQVDPSSQKASEGIRMATLLLGDWTPPPAGSGTEEGPAPAADGARVDMAGLSPQELEAKLDQGVARVRSLLAERKYSEAVEGARGLLPIDPDSEAVQKLIEEAQQAFESAPFIEEQITLSRELLAQERYPEAEAQCRKVFLIDPVNEEARALIEEIQDHARRDGSVARPAGGETMRISPEDLPVPQPPSGTPERGAAHGPEMDFAPGELEPTPDLVALSEEPAPAGGAPAPPQMDPAKAEEVEAKTIVPPSVRLVPRSPAKAAATPPSPPVEFKAGTPAEDPTAWETELTQLNLNAGQHDLLRGVPARQRLAKDDAGESDLMSILENDLSGVAEGPGEQTTSPTSGAEPAVASATRAEGPAAPRTTTETPRPVERPGRGVPPVVARSFKESAGSEAPVPPEPRGRSSAPRYFALLGVVILALGAAGWWFFLRPRTAAGAGSPAQPASPPADSPSGVGAGAGHGPIPTPIGGGSRQAAPAPTPASGKPVGDGAVALRTGDATPPTGSAAPAQVAGVAPAVAAPASPVPSTTVPPEEARRKVAAFLAAGRKLLAQGKWREAKQLLDAATEIDPVNFEVKEAADQAQAKLDEEAKARKEFDQAAALFADKDYQNTLWKLYRLPRDKGLGEIDRYIRNAWFNWAVISMKAGDATDALQKLSEALSTDPNDADALRLKEVAQRYSARPKDRLFFSFIDTLRLRTMDQK